MSSVTLYALSQVQNSSDTVVGTNVPVKFTGAGVSVALVSGKAVVTITGGVGGVIPVNLGGTNISSYSIGDILFASGITTLSKLGIGTSGQVLTVIGGVPSWQPAGSFSGTANTVAFLNGAGVVAQSVNFSYFATKNFFQLTSAPVTQFQPNGSMLVGKGNVGSSLLGTILSNLFVGSFGAYNLPVGSQFTNNFNFANSTADAMTLSSTSNVQRSMISCFNFNLATNINMFSSIILGGQFICSTAQVAPTNISSGLCINPGGSVSTGNSFLPIIVGNSNNISDIGSSTTSSLVIFGYANSFTSSTGFATNQVAMFGIGNNSGGTFENLQDVVLFGKANQASVDTTYMFGVNLSANVAGVGAYFGSGMNLLSDRTNFIFEFGTGSSNVTNRSSAGFRRNNGSFETKTPINYGTGTFTVSAGFTIPIPATSSIDLSGPTSTSSAVTAIGSGYNDSQILVLRNVGAGTYTIKANANTKQAGGADAVLTPGSTISYQWSNTLGDWLETSRSIV